jgi:hypothetical protein
MLCNDVQREGAKLSPSLASWLFCYVTLHAIWYGIIAWNLLSDLLQTATIVLS